MSSTPPEEPAGGSTQSSSSSSMSGSMTGLGISSGATLPMPGNAEFLLYLVVEIIFTIIWIAAESVDTAMWVRGDDRAHSYLHPQPRHREGEPRARAVARPTPART